MQRERALVRAARGRDQLETERARPSTRDQADAAGGRVPHDRVAALERAERRPRPREQIRDGHALEHHRGAARAVDVVRKPDDGRRVHHARGRVAAGLAARVRDAIADRDVRDAGADRFDDPGALGAEHRGQRDRVQPAAVIAVDEVDADRLVADAHLARTGIADLDVGELQHVGTTGAIDLDGADLHARRAYYYVRVSASSLPLVVVTGGAGFIGSHTVDRLIESGHRVVVLDNFSTGKRANLARWATDDRLRVEMCDVGHGIFAVLAPITAQLGPVTRIVHLAAQVSVVASVANPLVDMQINYGGTLHVLEYARAHGVKKVVFASSAAVYGDVTEMPVGEDVKCAPVSPYGIDSTPRSSRSITTRQCTACPRLVAVLQRVRAAPIRRARTPA